MSLPFTTEQFLDVFRRYNTAVWPVQWALLAIALTAVAYSTLGRPHSGRRVSAILALLWLWMAIAYHLAFFATINRAAVLFAVAFVAQGALFAWFSLPPRQLEFKPRMNAAGLAGAAFVLYALVGYPALGYALGHRYPAAPTFGVPCPTTVFTFGLLLWCVRPVPWRLLAIPTLWALVGTSAALTLGMIEDFALPLAALVTVGIAVTSRLRIRWQSTAAHPTAR
jgi:hypothetical protein